MNTLSINILKGLRKLYLRVFRLEDGKLEYEQDSDNASHMIYKLLIEDKPCMIARFGSNELLCVSTYIGVKTKKRNIFSYITGKSIEWWWNEENLRNMYFVAGFFPPEIEKFEQFCELMLDDMKSVDILGSWLLNELHFENELRNAKKVHFRLLEPYWSNNPWSMALEDKNVLVVHPFIDEINEQYKNKDLIFTKPILPKFNLITLRSVVSLAGEKTQFNDWFDAFEYMKSEIDKIDYDICLIGAGAYGFHLAAHVKRTGKKAIHLGGALQLMFGIRGKRWEDPTYGVKAWNIPYGYYRNMMNEYWIRPGELSIPQNVNKIEGGCYW